MKNKLISVIAVFLSSFCVLNADPVLTFFFKEYPEPERAPRLLRQFRQPDGIAQQSLRSLTPAIRTAGIFTSYFGFLNASDQNGQVIFPRKQSNALFKIVITDKIMPVMMFQSTVSHWELLPGTPAVLYTVEQKEDPSTQLIYWSVNQAALPDNKQIPPTDSIIIFAKPEHIYLPTGISLIQNGPNLILPDLYVKKNIQTTRNALYVLNLAFLFRPIDLLYKKLPQAYEALVEPE